MIPKLATILVATVLVTFFNVLIFIEFDGYYSTGIRGDYKGSHQNAFLQNTSGKYLINTTKCKIPNRDPFSADITEFIGKEEYTYCSDLELLTYIEKDFGVITVNINESLIPQYSSYEITCCYSEIHRVEGDDDEIRFTPCVSFKQSVEIYHPFIKVVCRNPFFIKAYENVHATTLSDDLHHLTNSDESKISVLFVGIDSVSKQNLQRTMPNTHRYLEQHFVNLNGYNKIGDNTYPNLMAILTGQNLKQLKETCPFNTNARISDDSKDYLSACDFIWKHFKRNGYTTGYGEDACPLSTFNYGKTGFPYPPTDYYYRPYFLAAEQLPTRQSKCHNRFCSGPENTGERIFNSAKDFSVTFKDRPSFGFIWTNTFSHDNINCPSAMDDKVLQFLSDSSFLGSLNKTIFVFYSDHGYRFGGIRQTNSGWLEERLPFIYLRIPEEFQREFPREYRNLLTNSRRLTTPYDLHSTLQHILKLSNTNYEFHKSPACPKCLSLFEEIYENRTCDEAGISQHWCTCTSYYHLSTTDPIVQNIAPLVVEKVNRLIHDFPEGDKCDTYSLDSVHSAGISATRINDNREEVNNILIMVNTKPKAMFEVTVEVPVGFSRPFKLVGDISRTDKYGTTSTCIRNSELKKYCYCTGMFAALKNNVCSSWNVC